MMKIFKEKIAPAKKYQELVKRRCDLCGLESTSSDWDAGLYEMNETEISIKIKQKEGENYPEGGYGTEYEIDLCPGCFKNRLIPWLKSEGAAVEEKEWDW
jgi:hypothetical protein